MQLKSNPKNRNRQLIYLTTEMILKNIFLNEGSKTHTQKQYYMIACIWNSRWAKWPGWRAALHPLGAKGGSGLLQRAEKIGGMMGMFFILIGGDHVSIYFVNSLICILTMSIFLCINCIFIRKIANIVFYILTT